MKCWWVSDASYDWQQIIFADTKHEAIYQSDGYENGSEYIEMRARRKKEWDKYAEQGFVPKEVLLEDGWWFECYGYNENGRRCWKHLTIDDKPLVVDNKVYCNQECCDRSKVSA